MLLVAGIREERRLPQPSPDGMGLLDRLKNKRSDIPAVTHLDYSARIQTVNRDVKPDYHAVISEFEKLTGCAVIVNTSFNVRGEPIICSPEDAYRCFMRTEMDVLVIADLGNAMQNSDVTHWNYTTIHKHWTFANLLTKTKIGQSCH
jgi:carbamoyltransferase